jgi:FlaA1/EpsC-like NDP-sugar epimerase
MNYSRRMTVLVLMDILIVGVSIYTSYLFRFDGDIPEIYVGQSFIYLIISALLSAAFLHYFKLYNRVWQYASIGEMISLFNAVTISCIVSYVVTCFLSVRVVPLSIFLRTFETTLLLMGGARFCWRIFRDNYIKRNKDHKRALIIGAGACGIFIAKELKHNATSPLYPVAFIDDNIYKQRMRILGIPIMGGRESIVRAVIDHRIDEIILAIPSLSRNETSKIIAICKQTNAKLKIVPKLDELIQGKPMSLKEIRNVEVEDLLGRDPVSIDLEGVADYVAGKTVLVTGAGGSIGSELCRQISPFLPSKLLLLGHGENSIYTIDKELRQLFPNLQIESVIADVQDKQRIQQVFATFRPQVVFHAAAHKHVPLMERNPEEAIKNNVFGSQNVADAADKYSAERFVLISTDKAVNPTSIMGATKRIAEMYIQSLGRSSKTKFVAVRFGNVLGSRGSVIPHFKEQIAQGGPVTVTHPEMIRYFMTIPEAVQLVIQAGSFARGGEIFILDMGQPVKILDLATDLIRLSGFIPGEDIEIQFSGIRPGEKLYEELLTIEEGLTSTVHNRIFVGKPSNISHTELELEFKRLERVLGDGQDIIKDVVKHIVPGYENVS